MNERAGLVHVIQPFHRSIAARVSQTSRRHWDAFACEEEYP